MTVTWERLAELVREATAMPQPMAALYFLIREEAAKEREAACCEWCSLPRNHMGLCRSKKS
jgi:hypothetical protein